MLQGGLAVWRGRGAGRACRVWSLFVLSLSVAVDTGGGGSGAAAAAAAVGGALQRGGRTSSELMPQGKWARRFCVLRIVCSQLCSHSMALLQCRAVQGGRWGWAEASAAASR